MRLTRTSLTAPLSLVLFCLFALLGLGSAAECDDGQYDDDGTCTDCPRGFFCSSGVKVDCPAGYYCPSTKMESPTSCPAGYFCPKTKTTNPLSCPAGTYSADAESQKCTVCAAGKSCPIRSKKEISCAPGTYCPAAVNLFDCPTGITASWNGKKCTSPFPGFIAMVDEDNKQNCVNDVCPHAIGTFPCPDTNAMCIQCASGKACAFSSMKSYKCSDKTQPCVAQQSRAAICPAGKYSTSDAAACSDCTDGHYCVQGSKTPLACPTGTYTPDSKPTGNSKCTPCPLGHYCTSATAEPTPCAAGKFAGALRLAECFTCVGATVSLSPGASACTSCGDGFVASEDHTTCVPQ